MKELPKSVRKTFPFLIVSKASKSEKNKGCEELEDKQKYSDFGLKERIENGNATNSRTNEEAKKAKNYHPTVKPIKLFIYLIVLGSRSGDTVCDPYIGSGTSGIACEISNRRWIGNDSSEDYIRIAMARLKRTIVHPNLPLSF